MQQIEKWHNDNNMIANTTKTKPLTVASRQALKSVTSLQIYLNGDRREELSSFNYWFADE